MWMFQRQMKHKREERLYNIGLFFKIYNLLPTLTVIENIILPCIGDTLKGRETQ
jgi:ABC-type lipoprotein export system ATPase subunit